MLSPVLWDSHTRSQLWGALAQQILYVAGGVKLEEKPAGCFHMSKLGKLLKRCIFSGTEKSK